MSDQNTSEWNPDLSGNISEKAASGNSQSSPSGFLHEQSWADRNGFPLWILAFAWVVVSFFLFQLVGTVFTVVYLIITTDVPLTGFSTELIIENIDVMFVGNSISQILFLGLTTWIFTGLSTTRPRALFLRFRTDEHTFPVIIQTVLLLIIIQPIIWMLSWLNTHLPFSESYMAFEQTQVEMLKTFLTGDHIILLTLIHVGVVPSVCEEILYRGYVQRALEKSWGIWAAIVLSGLLFGFYHIRLTQIIPLAFIGMLLAWVVWKSDSIFPAMAGHFVNNGGSVLLASLYPEYMMDQMVSTELPPPWLLLFSLGGSILLLRYIHHTTRRG